MELFPSRTVQPQPAEQNPAGPGLAERWKSWMSKPENAALLMQSGIAMLQPMQLGQTSLGAISSAVGEGFQARDRVRQSTAKAATDATKLQQDQTELDLRRREGEARAKYYENLGGRGRVSASAIFRDQNSDEARKQAAWLKFYADESWQSTDATPEEIYAEFEKVWAQNGGQMGGEPAPSALPGLETPAAAAPTGGKVPTATDAKGNKVQYVGGKWIPM